MSNILVYTLAIVMKKKKSFSGTHTNYKPDHLNIRIHPSDYISPPPRPVSTYLQPLFSAWQFSLFQPKLNSKLCDRLHWEPHGRLFSNLSPDHIYVFSRAVSRLVTYSQFFY